VRAGLILYLEATANPPAPVIDATAEVEDEVPELTPLTGVELTIYRSRVTGA
jgi:hypothetical protein